MGKQKLQFLLEKTRDGHSSLCIGLCHLRNLSSSSSRLPVNEVRKRGGGFELENNVTILTIARIGNREFVSSYRLRYKVPIKTEFRPMLNKYHYFSKINISYCIAFVIHLDIILVFSMQISFKNNLYNLL